MTVGHWLSDHGTETKFHGVTRSINSKCLKTINVGTGLCSLRSQSLTTIDVFTSVISEARRSIYKIHLR